jgi:hypothetical protein
MAGIRIGDAWYEDRTDAMVTCDCGHTVMINAAEEVWQGGKVTEICDACFFAVPQGE